MNPLPNVTFVLEDFAERSAGQHLLDRFLIGYNHNGDFVTPAEKVTLVAEKVTNRDALEARVKDFGLLVAPSLEQALRNAQFAVIATSGSGEIINSDLATRALKVLPNGARCWLYGVPGRDALSRELSSFSKTRGLALHTGTAASTPFQLPEIATPNPARVRKALVIAVGDFPLAEIEALEGLQSWLGARPATASNPHVRSLTRQQIWTAAYSSEWENLFASALSRSNTMQGDPELDGRTQDIVGLRLVEKLAPEPRGWLLTEPDGLRTLILVLNGAVKDFSLALQPSTGHPISSQLYRPPAPMLDHFSLFAYKVYAFFENESSASLSEMPFLPRVIEEMELLRR